MEIILWIILCTMAFIGAVGILGRLMYGFKPPQQSLRGILVIRLDSDSDIIRRQLEYYLSWIEWNGSGHSLLFVRDDFDGNAADMFERCFGTLPEVKLVEISRLAAMF